MTILKILIMFGLLSGGLTLALMTWLTKAQPIFSKTPTDQIPVIDRHTAAKFQTATFALG